MTCSHCQAPNDSGNYFCTSCGQPLPVQDGVDRSGDAVPDLNSDSSGMVGIVQEVSRLREIVDRMQARLVKLEQFNTRAKLGTGHVLGSTQGPVSMSPLGTTKDMLDVPSGSRTSERLRDLDWEQVVGGNWLARIGIVALIVGVAFFLKLAFDSNWVGPTGRVVIGILIGLVMLGGGNHWKQRYPVFAQTLTGGGVALLYLSIFAAFDVFNLIGFYSAFGFLFIVSASSVILSLFYDSRALAIIGIFGAFLAPLVLGGLGSGGDSVFKENWDFQVLLYVIVVDIGVLVLSMFRNWRELKFLALLGSHVTFTAWYFSVGSDGGILSSQGGLTGIFLIFWVSTTAFHVVKRHLPEAMDFTLMVANAIMFLTWSYILLNGEFHGWMGGFCLLLALFYGGTALGARMRGKENLRFAFLSLGLALLFLTIAIPVQFGHSVWTTISWALQGGILVYKNCSETTVVRHSNDHHKLQSTFAGRIGNYIK